ncbi:XdhC family protein [Rhodococcus rhodnii]|uniref:Xanthine dehydrogenase n=2 Tax=Rhodococcus rhodnii TaxID=38312 RepID=R7WPK2_9NOCA|nr:XdhC family protein [Rhodococcus rhodnii]EOM77238.1 xanthine dehydrogenase [Rhodococcus rhodnii LMG 5362]TXG90149.1 XdhC family protein [Rhodococcus rhodnii]
MHSYTAALRQWLSRDASFALATVVDLYGSAPRPIGTTMAVSRDEAVLGGVSGGCVEADLVARAASAVDEGEALTVGYGPDDGIFGVGPTCGGTMEIRLQPVITPAARAAIGETLAALDDGRAATLVLSRDGGHVEPGDPGLPDDTAEVRGDALVLRFAARPALLVVGAVDIADTLAALAAATGYTVTVCDARPTFATAERVPHAHRVVCARPDEFVAAADVDARTAIVVLSHDPKFDVPVLAHAATTAAFFVGAIGSRATHRARIDALRERGVPDDAIARIASPVGLDLAAVTPRETALSILSGVVAARRGGTGAPLHATDVAIHR